MVDFYFGDGWVRKFSAQFLHRLLNMLWVVFVIKKISSCHRHDDSFELISRRQSATELIQRTNSVLSFQRISCPESKSTANLSRRRDRCDEGLLVADVLNDSLWQVITNKPVDSCNLPRIWRCQKVKLKVMFFFLYIYKITTRVGTNREKC